MNEKTNLVRNGRESGIIYCDDAVRFGAVARKNVPIETTQASWKLN